MSRQETMSSLRSQYANMFILDQSHRRIAFRGRFGYLRIYWIAGHLARQDANNFLSGLGLQFDQGLY